MLSRLLHMCHEAAAAAAAAAVVHVHVHVHVGGCAAAPAAACWDGCAQRRDAGRTQLKDVQSGEIYPKATEQQTAQRLLFRLQLASSFASTSGPSGTGTPACAPPPPPPPPLTSPPAGSPRQVFCSPPSLVRGRR